MNKKIVAFALSTTALLGAGAMAETTPFAGTAARVAYAYQTEANTIYSGVLVGGVYTTLYADGTLVFRGGAIPASDLRNMVEILAEAYFPEGISLVFEDATQIQGNTAGLFKNMDITSVSGTVWLSGSMSEAFADCSKLKSFDLELAEGSSVTSMANMFSGDTALESARLSGWVTSGVTSMHGTFYGCTALKSLDASGWDVSGVEDMSMLFYNCSSLETVDVAQWETSAATDMTSIFDGCSGLETVDVSRWDTSSVTNMSGAFYGCSSLETVDVSAWDTGKVKVLGSMFEGCTALASLDLSAWDTSSVEYFTAMFSGCTSLESVDAAGWDFTSAIELDKLFENCGALASLDLSGWDTTTVKSASGMFSGAEKVSQLTLDSANGVGFLSGLPSNEDWVLSTNRKLGSFTVANLVSGWDNAKMAGTWYTASAAPAPIVTPVSVYRLYNPNSGEHFYTLSEVERDATVAAGWSYEGIGWYAPDESDAPVYRLYSGTDHHYTMDEEEKAALIEEGWVDEGIAFYSADPEDGIALLRQFNPFVDPEAAFNNSGSHNYTTDQVENDYLVSLGWQAEDVAFYGMVVEDVEA